MTDPIILDRRDPVPSAKAFLEQRDARSSARAGQAGDSGREGRPEGPAEAAGRYGEAADRLDADRARVAHGAGPQIPGRRIDQPQPPPCCDLPGEGPLRLHVFLLAGRFPAPRRNRAEHRHPLAITDGHLLPLDGRRLLVSALWRDDSCSTILRGACWLFDRRLSGTCRLLRIDHCRQAKTEHDGNGRGGPKESDLHPLPPTPTFAAICT